MQTTLELCVHYALSTTVSDIGKHENDVVPIPRKTKRKYRNCSFDGCHSISTISDRVGSIRILPPPPETRIGKVFVQFIRYSIRVYIYYVIFMVLRVPDVFRRRKKKVVGPVIRSNRQNVRSFILYFPLYVKSYNAER